MNPSSSAPGWQSIPDQTNVSATQQRSQPREQPRDNRLDRPLPPLPVPPPPPFSHSYEIPSLRHRPTPESVQAPRTRHGRSASHPFPALFSRKKADKNTSDGYNDDFSSPDGERLSGADLPRLRRGQPTSVSRSPIHSGQLQTGKCMTCASTVRWPQELKVFRCTTCLTINDLEPSSTRTRPGEHGTAHMPVQQETAVSLKKTQELVKDCLRTYLRGQLEQLKSPDSQFPQRSPASEGASPHIGYSLSPSTGSNDQQRIIRPPFYVPETEQSILMSIAAEQDREWALDQHDDSAAWQERPKVTANAKEVPRNGSYRELFLPVERYITQCFVGCETLNSSFLTVRFPHEPQDRFVRQTPATNHLSQSVSTPQLERDAFLSDLDGKTLLLGDVIENGSWWTGDPARHADPLSRNNDHGRSPEKSRTMASTRSPRIDWFELAEWYRIIVYAGDDWRTEWHAMRSSAETVLNMNEERTTRQLQDAIAEGQRHLRRTLLKSTENLLKRPRQPLHSPEHCRFLLILLANPLLQSPSHQQSQTNSRRTIPATFGAQSVSSIEPTQSEGLSTKVSSVIRDRSHGSGHHFGILKRIWGLLANLPNHVHQYLVSWISRFSDSHFQRILDMVNSFVTHRLSRQEAQAKRESMGFADDIVPTFSDNATQHVSQLHMTLGPRHSASRKTQGERPTLGIHSEDWQVRAAARVMAILFQANKGHPARRRNAMLLSEKPSQSAGLNVKRQALRQGQIVAVSAFYNSLLDQADLVGDFEAWEITKTKFTFCQYPFFLSIWAKSRILEYDARRQMESKAREAYFDSIMSRRNVSQYLVLKVRRDCLVDDSLRNVSETVGTGSSDIKKSLRIDFVGEEGVDAGGLRKEWFLLLIREIFDPQHGLFVYDEDSRFCYFNPYCFESSEQFFLVGVLLGLAIYNSTILDVAFPPFVFRKILASAPAMADSKLTSISRAFHRHTLEDLAELRPSLARGLQQLLDYDGDVEETFCRNFVVEVDRYGEKVEISLCPGACDRPVTNANRREFVDLYVKYLLDTAVSRQFEPFKRGFYTVCGGNALSLFQPDEIELLVRGSDEALDVGSLRAVASYDNWPKDAGPAEEQPQVKWFWDTFERATPADQRKLLGFITGSDRIPAMGATNLVIHVQLVRDQILEDLGTEITRFPTARTCFNTISLYRYRSRATLEHKLWMAVKESEGFGLK